MEAVGLVEAIGPFVEKGLGVVAFVALLVLVFRDFKEMKSLLRELTDEVKGLREVLLYGTDGDGEQPKRVLNGVSQKKRKVVDHERHN